MSGDNVIRANDRFMDKRLQGTPAPLGALQRPQGTPASLAALQLLQSTARTSDSDRILLAEKLGQAATRLNPSAPKKGAHAIMREAWGEDGSKKTGRLFILEGKQKPTLLESSGATWARLIEAAARLIVAKENHHPNMVDKAVRQHTGRLLRGTSFLPQSAQDTAQSQAVGEVLQRLADKFIHRLQTSTRIFELWQFLDGHPFTVKHVEGEQPPPQSIVPHASKLANDVNWLMQREADWKHYFVPFDPKNSWERPWTADIFIPVGAFVRRLKVRTFVPPRHVADVFLDPSKSDDEMWATFDRWHTGDDESIGETFPEYEYQDSVGHGAKYETVNALYFAYLRISPGGDKQPAVTFQVDCDDLECTAIPQLQDETIISDIITNAKPKHLKVIYHPLRCERAALVPHISVRSVIDQSYMEHGLVRIMNVEYGDQEDFCLRYRIDDFDDFETFSIGDDGNVARTLLYGAGEMTFIPAFAVEADKPTPTKPGSLADALLRNLDVAPEDQLVSIIEQHGKQIAEAGLGYHQALIDYYQDAIDRA